LSETELDLLADYREGLLEPEEAARIAELINTDERWSAANTILGPALAGVHTRFDELDAVGPMPGDVAARIDGELRALQPPASLDAARARRRAATPARLRLAAAALIVLALCGGVAVLIGPRLGAGNNATSSSAQDSRGSAAVPESVSVTHSGMNYTFGDLRRKFAAALPSAGAVKSAQDQSATPPQVPQPATAGSANPMNAGAAEPLEQCLQAVRHTFAGTPVTVDYGTYDGSPALIISLHDPDMVVAVPITCGDSGTVRALAVAQN
jgi:hypothetical protein